jgi:hypothetical protein
MSSLSPPMDVAQSINNKPCGTSGIIDFSIFSEERRGNLLETGKNVRNLAHNGRNVP